MDSAAPARHPHQNPPYQRSAPVLSFTVHGLPIPQGSKSYKGTTRDGRAILAESSKYLKPWRTQVTRAIAEAVDRAPAQAEGWPLLGPLAIDLIFTMRRPASAPKTRQTWPVVKPDVDKLARAILDAGSPQPRLSFTGAWTDDAQIVDVHAAKVYPLEAPGALTFPGVTATLYRIGADIAPGPAALQTELL